MVYTSVPVAIYTNCASLIISTKKSATARIRVDAVKSAWLTNHRSSANTCSVGMTSTISLICEAIKQGKTARPRLAFTAAICEATLVIISVAGAFG